MPAMTVTDRLARLNRRVLNPVIGKVAGRRLSPVAYMLHQGRKSGRQYRTPVMPLPLGDGFLVSLPYGPNRDWVRNVVAAAGRAPVRADRPTAAGRRRGGPAAAGGAAPGAAGGAPVPVHATIPGAVTRARYR
jgi:deazaflavin-dependent oxidoreductase (nitroreductase family)